MEWNDAVWVPLNNITSILLLKLQTLCTRIRTHKTNMTTTITTTKAKEVVKKSDCKQLGSRVELTNKYKRCTQHQISNRKYIYFSSFFSFVVCHYFSSYCDSHLVLLSTFISISSCFRNVYGLLFRDRKREKEKKKKMMLWPTEEEIASARIMLIDLFHLNHSLFASIVPNFFLFICFFFFVIFMVH